jgi:uncharacterized membrane protein YeaQ/YmgE (transglycosylase-associated protein family)
MGIISWAAVGAVAGWLAGLAVRGDERLGTVGNVVLGIVGAVLGGFLAGSVLVGDYVTELSVTTIEAAALGAILVVVICNLIVRRRARDRLG